MKIHRLMSALLGACIAGCASAGSAPLSFLNDNQVYLRANLNRFPVRVVAVDRSYNTFSPAPISPGIHRVVFSAAPVAGFHVPTEKTYTLQIAPCTRYYVAADRKNRLTQDWSLVIENQEEVGDCNPSKEIEKSAGSQKLGQQPAQGQGIILGG